MKEDGASLRLWSISALLSPDLPPVWIRKVERCKEQTYEETKDMYNIVLD